MVAPIAIEGCAAYQECAEEHRRNTVKSNWCFTTLTLVEAILRLVHAQVHVTQECQTSIRLEKAQYRNEYAVIVSLCINYGGQHLHMLNNMRFVEIHPRAACLPI